MSSRKQMVLLCNKCNPSFGNKFAKRYSQDEKNIKELTISVLTRVQLKIENSFSEEHNSWWIVQR